MKMHVAGTRGLDETLYIEFESVEDFEINRHKVPSENAWVHAQCAGHSSNLGHGVHYGTEAMRRVREGDAPTLNEMRRMLAHLDSKIARPLSTVAVRRRKRRMDEFGDVLHMPRVWSGDLSHAWERPVRTTHLQASERHAAIYIDLCANWQISPEQMMWRGAAAMLVSDLLQEAGRATEITVGSTNAGVYREWNGRTVTSFVAKEYGQPLSPERLAAMSTAYFHRTYNWMARAMFPLSIDRGLGSALNQGLPFDLARRREAGELVVRIGACFGLRAAERVVSDALASLERAEHRAA
jgi:hypothetical protein